MTSFFFLVLSKVPIIQLSGAIAPIENMLAVFCDISFNPFRHYVTIARNLTFKGVGTGVLLPKARIRSVCRIEPLPK